MPRYYFNASDGQNHPDCHGMNLADTTAAELEAIQFTGDLMVQAPDAFRQGREWSLKVLDGTSRIIFEISVRSQPYSVGR